MLWISDVVYELVALSPGVIFADFSSVLNEGVWLFPFNMCYGDFADSYVISISYYAAKSPKVSN